MARYRMTDGTVVDTNNSSQSWEEERDHNGNNFISRATGSQWAHETLFRSRKGRYYIERTSNWQGVLPGAEWISNEEATRWLLLMEYAIPEELRDLVDQVSE